MNSTPVYQITETIKSTEFLHFSCKKGFRHRRFRIVISKFFFVVPLAMKNFLAFRDGSHKVVGNVKFMLKLLIVDGDFNIGEN